MIATDEMTDLERLRIEYGEPGWVSLDPDYGASVLKVGGFIVQASEKRLTYPSMYTVVAEATHRHWMARE